MCGERTRHRADGAALGLEHDLAVDAALAGRKEGLEVGLERIVEEALVDQLHPLARHVRLEAVLCLAQHGFLERAMRGEQRRQAGRLEDDPALQADRGVAGVEAAADAVGGEHAG